MEFDAAKDGELGILSSGSAKKTFKFDRVYTPKDGQGTLLCLMYNFFVKKKISRQILETGILLRLQVVSVLTFLSYH